MRTGNENPRAEGLEGILSYPSVLPSRVAAASDAGTVPPGMAGPVHGLYTTWNEH